MIWCGYYKEIETKWNENSLRQILSVPGWYSSVPDCTRMDNGQLMFRIKQKSLIYTNSFQPDFHLEIQPGDMGAKVRVKVTMKPGIRVFMVVYDCLCAALQIGLLIMWVRGGVDCSFPMFLPALIVLFEQLLMYVALWLSARPFMKALRDALK